MAIGLPLARVAPPISACSAMSKQTENLKSWGGDFGDILIPPLFGLIALRRLPKIKKLGRRLLEI